MCKKDCFESSIIKKVMFTAHGKETIHICRRCLRNSDIGEDRPRHPNR
jgi:hypothetical protein